MKIYSVILLLFTSYGVHAQPEIDSLENLLNSTNGTERVDLLISLGNKLFYKDPVRSERYARLAQKESHSLEYPNGIASGFYIRGIIHDIAGNQDSSQFLFNQGYEISKKYELTYLEGSGLNNLGMMNWNLSNYNKALEYFLEALRVYELDKNEKGISKAISNIGLIYQELHQYQKALAYNFRSLKLRLQSKNLDHIARSYNNIGICFRNLQKTDSAIHYFNIGLEYAIRDQGKEVQGSIYDNLANVYNDLEEHAQAIEYHLLSLSMRQVGSHTRAASHANLSSLYLETGEVSQALKNALIADSIMRIHSIPHFSVENYFNLANAYLQLNQRDSAIKYFEKWRKISEEVFGEESSRAVAEMQTKYETEKKEQQLVLLESEKRLKEAELEESRIVIILIVILSVVIFIAIILFNSRRRYKLKEVLAVAKEELQRNRFKAVIAAEEKERKRIARELHDGLGQLLSTARINISTVGNREDKKVVNSLMLIDQSIEEVRNISHNLMPNALISVGLRSAIMGLVGQINDSGEVTVQANLECDFNFNEEMTIGIFRIIQELINNALKYSESLTIDLEMIDEGENLKLTISDKGKGFDTTQIGQSEGIGWSSIYSRVDLMNGKIDIYSKLGKGTTVNITVPKDGRSDQAAAS